MTSTRNYYYKFLNSTGRADTKNNNTLVTDIKVGHGAQSIAFEPNNGYLYVANDLLETTDDNDTVSVIDTKNNNTLVTEIPIGGYPDGIAIDPDNGYLYVSNSVNKLGNNTVLVIDTNRITNMSTAK